jgi:hypothetical protein
LTPAQGTKSPEPCFAVMMRPRATDVPLREMINHLLSGAALGTFLGLSLIVANSTIFDAIVDSPHPTLTVLVVIAGMASIIAVGSAISGFIISALDRS